MQNKTYAGVLVNGKVTAKDIKNGTDRHFANSRSQKIISCQNVSGNEISIVYSDGVCVVWNVDTDVHRRLL